MKKTKNKKERSLEWIDGNRAFYWNEGIDYISKPLCLQSKEYNREMKGITWVYYSKRDAKELLKFLKKALMDKK